MFSFCPLFIDCKFNGVCVLQPDGSMALDSDEGEEPSPEAMARYLSMRRHTVGVPDQR